MSKLIIAVATGNMVANLPPLFELAGGDDVILWLESDWAKKNKLVDRILPLLNKRNLGANIGRLEYPESMSEMLASVKQKVGERIEQRTLYLICNGGTKLHFGVLLEALREFNPTLIYSDGGSTGWQEYAPDWHGGEIKPYAKAAITLEDVLACRSYHLGKGELIWDANWNEQHRAQYTEQILSYGENVTDTIALHEAHHSLAAQRKTIEGTDLPSFDALMQSSKSEGWVDAVKNFLGYVKKNEPSLDSLKSGLSNQSPVYKQACALYSSTLNVAKKVADDASKNENSKPALAIGPVFEKAVSKRVIAYLNQRYPELRNKVSQVYLGATFLDEKEMKIAETDVLLIAKNGILLHLECKTFEATQKDLDARIANLHEASSDLAKMYVVMPVYTDYMDKDWAVVSRNLFDRIQNGSKKLSTLPFTLPVQSKTFSTETGDIQIPYFEESLGMIFKQLN